MAVTEAQQHGSASIVNGKRIRSHPIRRLPDNSINSIVDCGICSVVDSHILDPQAIAIHEVTEWDVCRMPPIDPSELG
jgi:hypothetical protein